MSHSSDPYPKVSRKTISAAGLHLAYLEAGDGPPLLLIHGYGGGAIAWEHQIPALARRFRVFAPDLPGHGGSEKPHVPYRPDLFVRAMEGFLDAVGLDRPVVIGQSMGGAVALALASRRPERVDRLVLIDPLVPGFTPNTLLLRTLFTLRKASFLFRLYFTLGGTQATRWSLKYMVHQRHLITDEVVARFHLLKQGEEFLDAFLSTGRHLREWDTYTQEIRRVSHPTLILWGAKDRYFSIEDGRRLAALLPDARLAVIPEAGHIPMWECPGEVNREIEMFLVLSNAGFYAKMPAP